MRSLLTALGIVCVAACSSSPSAPDSSTPLDAGTADAGSTPDLGPPDLGPPLEWGPCPVRFRDECATVAMPLDHDHPEGETIDVQISRWGAGGGKQLWLLQGGPGGSADAFYGLHDFLQTLDPELEVYTIEHRGVGASTRIGCSAEERTSPGGEAILPEELAACRDEIVATWGDRLAFFSATQAAHDLAYAIDRTRRPDQPVFVYGASYGTFWANRYAVLHPDQPDGVILDGPVSPGTTLEDYDLWFEPIGQRVFSELCAATPRCAEKLGPDPLAFVERVYADLQAGHCSELMVPPEQWPVVFAVFLMSYAVRDWLPALVYRLDRCSPEDQTAIATLFPHVFPHPATSPPRKSQMLGLNVLLSELWPHGHADDADVVAARATNVFFQDANADAFVLEDSWPRYDLGALASAYAPPEVPVLTMSGELDPAAPPAIAGVGYRDHLGGPHQTYVEMPFGAHTVLTSSPVDDGTVGCGAQLVRAFLADPTSALPVSCVPHVRAPSFDATTDVSMRFFGTSDLYD